MLTILNNLTKLDYLNNYYYHREYSEVNLIDNVIKIKLLLSNTVKEDIKVTLTNELLKVFKDSTLAYYLDIKKYKINRNKIVSKFEGEMLYIDLPLIEEQEYVIKIE